MDQSWIHAIINAHAIGEKNVNPAGVGMLDRRGAWVGVCEGGGEETSL